MGYPWEHRKVHSWGGERSVNDGKHWKVGRVALKSGRWRFTSVKRSSRATLSVGAGSGE